MSNLKLIHGSCAEQAAGFVDSGGKIERIFWGRCGGGKGKAKNCLRNFFNALL